MNLPDFISFTLPDKPGALYLMQTGYPFIIGKLSKFNRQDIAKNFHYEINGGVKRKVPGYNIFITSAGFIAKPQGVIQKGEIERTIEAMCGHYFETVIDGNTHIEKNFKTTWK